jgi:hypothetical protein
MFHRSHTVVEDEPRADRATPATRSRPGPSAVYTTGRDDVYEEQVEDRVRPAPVWSVAQVIGLAAGLWFMILGIAAVSNTGFDTSHIYTPHAVTWSFPHSPLLAVIEIAFGVLLLLVSVVPDASTSLVAFLGAIALAFGIVVVTNASSSRLTHWLGVSHRNGWLYTGIGAVLLLAALVSPMLTRGSTYRRRRAMVARSS